MSSPGKLQQEGEGGGSGSWRLGKLRSGLVLLSEHSSYWRLQAGKRRLSFYRTQPGSGVGKSVLLWGKGDSVFQARGVWLGKGAGGEGERGRLV